MQPKFDALYRALVTSNVDPSLSGKIKVQCPQISGVAEIRFAEPANPQMPLPLVGSTVWIAFSGGDITKPTYFTNNSYVNLTNATTLHAQSPISGSSNDAAQLLLSSGADGALSGAGNTPSVTFIDGNGTTPVDVRLSGSIIKVTDTGTDYTWQTPSYNANWAASTTFNTGSNWGPLQYRFDGEDNVWLLGSFKATGVPGVSVFNLPTAYRPMQQWPVPCHQNHATALAYISLEIGASGNVNVLTTVGGNLASGNEYLVNGKFPLGNII